jgi:hypothetical protein
MKRLKLNRRAWGSDRSGLALEKVIIRQASCGSGQTDLGSDVCPLGGEGPQRASEQSHSEQHTVPRVGGPAATRPPLLLRARRILPWSACVSSLTGASHRFYPPKHTKGRHVPKGTKEGAWALYSASAFHALPLRISHQQALPLPLRRPAAVHAVSLRVSTARPQVVDRHLLLHATRPKAIREKPSSHRQINPRASAAMHGHHGHPPRAWSARAS